MALAVHDPDDCTRVNKGKGPAVLSERTPLLPPEPGESSHAVFSHDDDAHGFHPDSRAARRRLWSILSLVFFTSLFVSLLALGIVTLLAYSFAARLADDDLLARALVISGPARVDVLNATDGGLWLQLDASIGIDVDTVVADDGDVWRSIARLGVGLMKSISAHVSGDVYLYAVNGERGEGEKGALLGTVSMPPLGKVPVVADASPHDLSWLKPVSLVLFVRPTEDSATLASFVDGAWRGGVAAAWVDVPGARVRSGEGGWRSVLRWTVPPLEVRVTLRVPTLPGLPPPGQGQPLPDIAKLITLQGFNIESSPHGLTLKALATAVNVSPEGIEVTVPSLPFIISILDEAEPAPDLAPALADAVVVPIASVHTAPISLASRKNITIAVLGDVLPLDRSAVGPLSHFVSRFLSQAPHNPILLSSPLLPALALRTDFPPPATPPQILRNVTIRGMKVSADPTGNELVASGQVFARVVLPAGLNFEMDVRRVYPDLLVLNEDDHRYDGDYRRDNYAVYDDGDDNDYSVPSVRLSQGSLPDPLPPRAFGHIRPADWLNATSVYDGDEAGGSAFRVTADIVDVPIKVLPGREKEFGEFVRKVIFSSHGAVAVLEGTTDIAMHIVGLPLPDGGDGDGDEGNGESEFQLHGLPLRGTVRIGKKFFFGLGVDRDDRSGGA